MVENLECRRFRNRIDAYMDSELTPSEREEMLRHAQSCPECGKLLKEYQDMLAMLGEMDRDLEIPPEAAQAWRSGVRDECERKKQSKSPNWVRAVASIAAAAVALVGITAAFRNGLWPTDSMPMSDKGGNYEESYNTDADSEYTEMTGSTTRAATLSMTNGAAPQSGSVVESDGAADTLLTGAATTQQKPVILRSATRSLESTAFTEALATLDALTEEYGGWYEYRAVSGRAFAEGGSGRRATLEVRVPSDKLDEYLEALKNAGAVVKATDSAEDVSPQYYDSQTRLVALRAQYARLTDLITDAADLNDLVLLEDKLYEVQYEIDLLEGELRGLDSRANYSTVSLTFAEVKEYTEPQVETTTLGERIRKGFADSVEWLKTFLQDMIVAFVAFLPALVVIVPALFILWLIVHSIRKRRRRAL